MEMRGSGCIHKDNEGEYVQLQGKMGSIVKNCLIKEYKIPAKYINVIWCCLFEYTFVMRMDLWGWVVY